jgi:Arc-like DNA binding domain
MNFVPFCRLHPSLEVTVARKDQELRPVMTRIPERLRRQLEREAEKNRRSMNAEIIHRLEQSFQAKYWAKVVGPIVEHAVSTGLHNATIFSGDMGTDTAQPNRRIRSAPQSPQQSGTAEPYWRTRSAPQSADQQSPPDKKTEGEGQ